MTLLCAAQALHARMQPLLLFFVDGGSAVDADDPGWDLLLALRIEGARATVVRAPQTFRWRNLVSPGADHADVRRKTRCSRFAPKEGRRIDVYGTQHPRKSDCLFQALMHSA